MRISINHFLAIIISAVLVATACKKDKVIQKQIVGNGLIETIRNNNLENIIIPHRINSFPRIEMVQNLGFRGWELDLNYYIENGLPTFRVKHDYFLSPTLEEYLKKANLKNVDKLWFDIKNLNAQNFSGIKLRINQLDSMFNLKNRIIFETSNTSIMLKYFSEKGWHTTYYLPFWTIDKWIENNDTIAQKQYAISLTQQLHMQEVEAISFDVSCYSFVKQFLEDKIPSTIVYHTWDLSLKLNDQDFIDMYKKKVYSKDTRIKTVLIPID